MKTFEKNIINSFRENGRNWLSNLPNIISALSKTWNLTDINPIKNLSWNYVVTAMQNNTPVVIKVSCDKELIMYEYSALKVFQDHGSIKLLDFQSEYNALLLEKAIPGYTLKTSNITLQEKINIYANVALKLKSSSAVNGTNFKHVDHWLKDIDKITDTRIGTHLVELAQNLRSHILATIKDEYLCHGDLHLENIINNGSAWLAIDPKGIIGDLAFEVAAFDLLTKEELEAPHDLSALILERANLLGNAFGLDIQHLLNWIYLRVIISAQWFIEDGGDPSFMLKIAENIYILLKR